MCRILVARAEAPVDVRPLVRAFAERCRRSKEFQGHGWGVAWREDGAWRTLRRIEPIWERELPELPPSRLFLVHARSAFRDEGIAVDNNMPFVEGRLAFAFNGELRGVRLRAPGATGAWRLFHLLRRFSTADADGLAALRRLDTVVAGRTDYVRALNVVTSDGERVWVGTRWSEDPEYFTLWHARTRVAGEVVTLVGSERFDVEDAPGTAWLPVPNRTTVELGALAGAGAPAPTDSYADAAVPGEVVACSS